MEIKSLVVRKEATCKLKRGTELPLDVYFITFRYTLDGTVCALNVMVCVMRTWQYFWSFYMDPRKNDRVRKKHSWRVQMIFFVPNVKRFMETSQESEETHGGG